MFKKDIKFFNVAKSLSKISDFNRIHIGAIIVHNNEVLGSGYNQRKSHPLQKKLNGLRFHKFFTDSSKHYLHAEMEAIIHSKNKDLKGASIYVYRENMHGDIAMCRPCPACMAKIKEKGIKKIFYTTNDGFVEEILI